MRPYLWTEFFNLKQYGIGKVLYPHYLGAVLFVFALACLLEWVRQLIFRYTRLDALIEKGTARLQRRIERLAAPEDAAKN